MRNIIILATILLLVGCQNKDENQVIIQKQYNSTVTVNQVDNNEASVGQDRRTNRQNLREAYRLDADFKQTVRALERFGFSTEVDEAMLKSQRVINALDFIVDQDSSSLRDEQISNAVAEISSYHTIALASIDHSKQKILEVRIHQNEIVADYKKWKVTTQSAGIYDSELDQKYQKLVNKAALVTDQHEVELSNLAQTIDKNNQIVNLLIKN